MTETGCAGSSDLSHDAERLTATEASALIGQQAMTSEALVSACLDRVKSRDAEVRAWTHLDADAALLQARARDAEPVRGPLHGIPVGVKDILFTQDMPTSYNSPHFQGHFPKLDASGVAILRAAGAVIFGKNDTVEFAVNGRRAQTRNPHDLTRTPGGSSSGSAAAVADYQVPLSLGTQTGGSVIRPASYCGVYGMKPTWNAVSHEGFKVCSASMDTLGWYGRSAADLALLCDVFGIHDDAEPSIQSLAGERVAICRSPVWDQALPETRAAIESCIELLTAAGAEIVDLELDARFDGLTQAHKIVMQSEMRSAFLPQFLEFGDALYPEMVETMRNAAGMSRADQVKAYDLAAECRARFDEIAAPFTAVLTPSAPGEAPVGLENTGAAVFNRIWTLLHVPCVNVPGLSGPSGLPVGVSVIGPRFSDRRVILVADQLGRLIAGRAASTHHAQKLSDRI